MVICNNYRALKKIHRMRVHLVDPAFDVNIGKLTSGLKCKKCSYDHSVLVNALIIVKDKYLYELNISIINQISNFL